MVLVQRRHLYPHFRWNRANRAMNRLLRESLALPVERRLAHSRLPVDIYSTQEAFVVQSNVPGAKPEDVEITIEDDTLTIKATLPGPAEDVEYAFRERSSGEYERTFKLNVPVNAEAAEATFENGVLTLTVPKAEEAKPKKIEVKTV